MCARDLFRVTCSKFSSSCGTSFFVLVIATLALMIATPSVQSAQKDDWLKDGLPDNVLSKPDKKNKNAPADGIPRAAKSQLTKDVIPALKSGDDDAFLQAMFVLVSKQSEDVIEAVEAYGQKNSLGSLKSHFTEALIRGVSRGMPINTKVLKPSLVQFTTAGLMEKIEAELDEIDKHKMMQNPLRLPFEWSDNEKIFWDVHVWKNRFSNIDKLLVFTKRVQKPLLDRAIKADLDDQIELYRKPFILAKRVSSTYRDMIEREAELRVQAMAQAESTLRLGQDIEDRLNAAFALEMHGGELSSLFSRQPPGNFMREKLNDQTLIAQCTAIMKSGRELGKNEIQKAMMLRMGAHWWLRGRYGRSTEAFGLLKPIGAMRSEKDMFGLLMPQNRPKPIGFIDSESGYESEGYDRRHYFTWAIERRDVIRTLNKGSSTDSVSNPTGKSSGSLFW